MTPQQITGFLHAQIPLAAAMSAEVVERQPHALVVRAPLPPNRNRHGTAFGGSLATLSILCAWTVVHFGLQDAALSSRLVVQKSDCEFLKPGTDTLFAHSHLDADAWRRFTETVQRRGRGRLAVGTTIRCGEVEVVRHQGVFVAQR